ncbi:MAG: acyl-CoA synthetase (AMP-forming)/AMP-acid ligase II [Candidatus Azotimanducaceae bacterium]|jgi:acyl-CoA synthetase (AMP-forming)/AMP-acid ligase II
MNIAMLLQMAAETFPERIALTSAGKHYSYSELYSAAQNAAKIFTDSGCKYVSVLDTSSPAIPIALFGAGIAGVPYVPLNYRLSSSELQKLLERVAPVYLITNDEQREQLGGQDIQIIQSTEAFLDSTLAGENTEVEASDGGDAIAVQLFTSGTTGQPKAAILRHENLVSYILGSVEFMGAAEDEANLVTVPPYHIAGISAVLSSFYAGRRVVQLPNFSPDAWLALCESQSISNAFVVPTMLSRVMEHIEGLEIKPALGSLNSVAYGGGKMPINIIKLAIIAFPHVNFTNAYGLTETSSTIAVLGPEDHRVANNSDDSEIHRRLGSVGKPLPSVEIEIRNDEGTVLGHNQSGEIYVRGPQVSGEYIERDAKDGDGWFPTRDAGFLDEEGYLFLSGRADDVIVRGGENISPGEIEEVLMDHENVTDAMVLGIPSDEWGEAVVAVVVLKSGADVHISELQTMVREKLRSSRVPEQILIEPALPYNDMGKLIRREIKALFL